MHQGKYEIKNALDNHCWKLWHACVISWDGLVVPCCFDKDADYRLGDLKKDSFKEYGIVKPIKPLEKNY
jgi:MoaA/NifB/PqqE/SkfB family radical SAM enzyme